MSDNNHDPDPENMIGYIDALPEDLEKAWKLGFEFPLPEFPKITQVLISGMGGSAIGGDLLASFLAPLSKVSINSNRNYGLPEWAEGKNTLVICSSHSGNTEETISSFHTALQKECSIFVLCTGGKLHELAQTHHVPAWIFEHTGQPRTAIPYSFGLLLALMQRLGLVNDQDAALADAVQVMQDNKTYLTLTSPLAADPARRMAGQLLERNIVIFAAGELEVIARRWKTQINELAKGWASFEGLPEADHNTLAGLENPENLFEKTSAIFLRANMDHPRNALRLEATQRSCLQAGIATDTVWAKGTTRLAQFWSLLQLGDYVAYYLALNYGVDPTPIEIMTQLKKWMAQN